MDRSVSSPSANCSSLPLVLFLSSSTNNCSTLALVLFLISRLFRSCICIYVSFNTGMGGDKHEVVGGGEEGEGEEAQNESVFVG